MSPFSQYSKLNEIHIRHCAGFKFVQLFMYQMVLYISETLVWFSALCGLRKAVKEKIMGASNAMNVKSFFQPYDFNVGKVNVALKKAFHSNSSNPSGSKMFHFPLSPHAEGRFKSGTNIRQLNV